MHIMPWVDTRWNWLSTWELFGLRLKHNGDRNKSVTCAICDHSCKCTLMSVHWNDQKLFTCHLFVIFSWLIGCHSNGLAHLYRKISSCSNNYSYPLEKIFVSSNRWGYPFKRKKNHLFKLLRLFVRIRTAKVKHSKKLMICSNNWGYPFN